MTMIFFRTIVFFAFTITVGKTNFLNFPSFQTITSYARFLELGNLTENAVGNELWTGILSDCNKEMSFSCIQKNTYSYLDNVLVERDNITIFSGLVLRKNHLNYDICSEDCQNDLDENIVENSGRKGSDRQNYQENTKDNSDLNKNLYEEKMTPLEEVTLALRDKTVKFLATRDYEIQLPEFFFESSKIKISPREVDESGAIVRIDFKDKALESQGRIFKKIRKFIQNRLLMSFLALILIIKLIKVKFMFIIPFLFGVGTAKKIFLKILLFLVPAFAHVFKLCSSYYSSHTKYHHHHHHQIAHHHHHVPVPVPIPSPAFYDHHTHHPSQHEEEFEGYDYAHPHIQLRKDMEELKEWGIDAFGEPYDDPSVQPIVSGPGPLPLPSPSYVPNFSVSQSPTSVKQNLLSYQQTGSSNIPSHGQTLAYNGYLEEQKLHRRVSSQIPSSPFPQVQANTLVKQSPISVSTSTFKSKAAPVNAVYVQPSSVLQTHRVTQQIAPKNTAVSFGHVTNQVVNNDTFYESILERLDEIFTQLRFVEESCKERLICSMYKNPSLYSPHSNLVSNELSRDPQELRRGATLLRQRFDRYINAARLGQDGGDCYRAYTCHKNTK